MRPQGRELFNVGTRRPCASLSASACSVSRPLTAAVHDLGRSIKPSRNAPMPTEITQAELARVRDWANRQLAHGGEQPWSAFLLTRLGEPSGPLLARMAASQPDRP